MRPRWFRRLLPFFMVLALTGPVRAQSTPPLAWWREPKFQRDLGLTTTSRIGSTGSSRPRSRTCVKRRPSSDAQEAELSRLIEANVDEAIIGRQSDHVEVIRADLNKSRTLMLVHMRQILSPEQRDKFKVLREERDTAERLRSCAGETISDQVTPQIRSRLILPKGTAMTRNRSIWITAVALTLAGVTVPAHAQQLTEARIQELVRQAAERVSSSGDASDARLRPRRRRRGRAADAGRCRESGARSQPGHRRPAAQPRDQRHLVREPESRLPPGADLADLATQSQTNAVDIDDRGRRERRVRRSGRG